MGNDAMKEFTGGNPMRERPLVSTLMCASFIALTVQSFADEYASVQEAKDMDRRIASMEKQLDGMGSLPTPTQDLDQRIAVMEKQLDVKKSQDRYGNPVIPDCGNAC